MIHHRILMKIPCGGGHRSWDCILKNNLIMFLYIRNKQVYASDFSLTSFTLPVLLVSNFFLFYFFMKIYIKIILYIFFLIFRMVFIRKKYLV